MVPGDGWLRALVVWAASFLFQPILNHGYIQNTRGLCCWPSIYQSSFIHTTPIFSPHWLLKFGSIWPCLIVILIVSSVKLPAHSVCIGNSRSRVLQNKNFEFKAGVVWSTESWQTYLNTSKRHLNMFNILIRASTLTYAFPPLMTLSWKSTLLLLITKPIPN